MDGSTTTLRTLDALETEGVQLSLARLVNLTLATTLASTMRRQPQAIGQVCAGWGHPGNTAWRSA